MTKLIAEQTQDGVSRRPVVAGESDRQTLDEEIGATKWESQSAVQAQGHS